MSEVSKPTNNRGKRQVAERDGGAPGTGTQRVGLSRSATSRLPTYMSNHELSEAILTGIAGHQRSFARWALSELLNRLTCSEGIEK